MTLNGVQCNATVFAAKLICTCVLRHRPQIRSVRSNSLTFVVGPAKTNLDCPKFVARSVCTAPDGLLLWSQAVRLREHADATAVRSADCYIEPFRCNPQ